MNIEDFMPEIPFPGLIEDSVHLRPRRVTMVKKTCDTVTFVVSKGTERIEWGVPIHDAFLIEIYNRRRKMTVTYQEALAFHRQQIGDVSYTLMCGTIGSEPFRRKGYVIPYATPDEFPSTVANDVFHDYISQVLATTSECVESVIDSIAKKGLVRTIVHKEPQLRKLFKERQELVQAVYTQVLDLFKDAPEQERISRKNIEKCDRKLPEGLIYHNVFHLANMAILNPAILSLLPSNSLEYMRWKLQKDANRLYEFNVDSIEQRAIALSEYMVTKPYLFAGLKRGFTEAKALSDLLVFAGQIASTAFVTQNTPGWLSISFAAPQIISAIVRMRNAYTSGGQNYSGIVSSISAKSFNFMMYSKKSTTNTL